MKRASLFLTTLVLAALLLAACGGQETSTSVPGTNVPPAMELATSTEMPAATAASETAGTTTANVPVTGDDSPNRLTNLMDYDVWNQNGDQIGTVNDMVLDFDNTSIAYAVVGTGGFLGLGEKNVLVPWDLLKLQTAGNGAAGDQNAFVFTGNQDAYNNAPDTDLSTLLPGTGQPAANWDANLQDFWRNGGTSAANGQATNTPEGGANVTALPVMTATAGAGKGTGAVNSQGAGAQPLQGVVLASNLLDSTIQIINSQTGATNGQVQTTGTDTPAANQAATTATSDVSGAANSAAATDSVSGLGMGNTLGTMDLTVDDAIVDPKTGTVQYLVVTGAFTGGQRTVAVPVKYLRWDATNQAFSMGVNSIALVNAPAFEDGQYPDFSNNDWSNQLNDYWNNLKSDMLVGTPAP